MGEALAFRAIPGHEFSGVVAALGEGVVGFEVGQDVFGMNDWFSEGATAEFCTTDPLCIAPKPTNVSHVEAASVPIGALTAWQGLIDRAKIREGERVLVHGGAGAVGVFAVQLARMYEAHVITTVSAGDVEFVTGLGADEVIDYKSVRFDEVVRDVDVVFDAVGGKTLDDSWKVLKPGGRMVTISSEGEGRQDQRTKDAFFIVEPNQRELMEMARLLDDERLLTFVKAVVPFGDAGLAYSGEVSPNGRRGKVVVEVS